MGANIETGVDRLVQLIAKNEKISIQDASKSLGVSTLVVNEWAEFLEKEELISIEYGLSKTYLKPRAVSAKELEKHSKDFANKKDAFVRKVDSALVQLEQHHSNAEEIKKEFESLKDDLGGEVDAVREQLEQLKKYENAKKNIDSDIQKEFDKYEKRISDAHDLLEDERKRFSTILGELQEQEERLTKQEESLESIDELKERLAKKSEEVQELLDKANKEMKSRSKDVDETHKHITKLQKKLAKEKDKLEDIKTHKLEALEEQSKQHEKDISEMHKEISAQAKEAKKRISDDVSEGEKAAHEFEKFFEKRLNADKVLADLEKQRKKMQQEYDALKKKALSFQIAGKSKTSKELAALQKKYDQLDKEHESYKKKLKEVAKHVFG